MADGSDPKPPRPRRAKAPTTPDPIEIAMEAEAEGSEPEGRAGRLLGEQIELIRLDRRHRAWQIASERAGVTIKVLTGLVGVLILGWAGLTAWQAHNDHSLTIAAFKTPPEFEGRGLGGEVLAAHLQDRLLTLQRETLTFTQGAQVRDAQATEIKVDIAASGLSLTEAQHLIRDWFSQATPINADVSVGAAPADGPAPLALNLRIGGQPVATLRQPDGDIDALVQGAAEKVYETTDPLRFSQYLAQHGRGEESAALVQRISLTGAPEDRARALVMLAQSSAPEDRLPIIRTALRLAPNSPVAWNSLSAAETSLGHYELSVQARLRSIKEAKQRPRDGEAQAARKNATLTYYLLRGAYLDDLALWCEDFHVDPCSTNGLTAAALTSRPDSFANDPDGPTRYLGFAQPIAFNHDTGNAARLLDAPRPYLDAMSPARAAAAQARSLLVWQMIDVVRADWPAVLRHGELRAALVSKNPALRARSYDICYPALALAQLDRATEAAAAIALSPRDDYACVRIRAMIAERAGDRTGADRWFAEAVRQAPSGPQAYAEWGFALLARGEPDAAIAKLKIAAKLSPHFADPLEIWGEALMAKGDYRGAARKFEQANRYAPRWGRLHLMWSQALAKSGDAEGARRHDRIAHSLDLTPPSPLVGT